MMTILIALNRIYCTRLVDEKLIFIKLENRNKLLGAVNYIDDLNGGLGLGNGGASLHKDEALVHICNLDY